MTKAQIIQSEKFLKKRRTRKYMNPTRWTERSLVASRIKMASLHKRCNASWCKTRRVRRIKLWAWDKRYPHLASTQARSNSQTTSLSHRSCLSRSTTRMMTSARRRKGLSSMTWFYHETVFRLIKTGWSNKTKHSWASSSFKEATVARLNQWSTSSKQQI